MKIEKQLSLRRIGFLIAMPLIAWLTNYILYDERIFRQWTVWLFSFPLICVLGYIGWVVQMWCLAKVQHRFPSLKQTTPRVMIVTAVTSLIVFLFFSYNLWYLSFFQHSGLPILKGRFKACINSWHLRESHVYNLDRSILFY